MRGRVAAIGRRRPLRRAAAHVHDVAARSQQGRHGPMCALTAVRALQLPPDVHLACHHRDREDGQKARLSDLFAGKPPCLLHLAHRGILPSMLGIVRGELGVHGSAGGPGE